MAAISNLQELEAGTLATHDQKRLQGSSTPPLARLYHLYVGVFPTGASLKTKTAVTSRSPQKWKQFSFCWVVFQKHKLEHRDFNGREIQTSNRHSQSSSPALGASMPNPSAHLRQARRVWLRGSLWRRLSSASFTISMLWCVISIFCYQCLSTLPSRFWGFPPTSCFSWWIGQQEKEAPHQLMRKTQLTIRDMIPVYQVLVYVK